MTLKVRNIIFMDDKEIADMLADEQNTITPSYYKVEVYDWKDDWKGMGNLLWRTYHRTSRAAETTFRKLLERYKHRLNDKRGEQLSIDKLEDSDEDGWQLRNRIGWDPEFKRFDFGQGEVQ